MYAEGEAPPRRFSDASRESQGYPAPRDTADIWRLWVENGRRGAVELIARYSAEPSEPVEPAAPLRMLGDPDPAKLARHVELYGREGAEPWLHLHEGEGGEQGRAAQAVDAVIRRRSRSRRMVTRA